VGLLSRAGTDLEIVHRHTLERLAINLDGVAFYDDLPTLRGTLMAYDSQDYMISADETGNSVEQQENWSCMLSRPLALPPSYRAPRIIHLVTEYADEPMVVTALALREQGALVSLEPLIDGRAWSNRAAMLALLRHVDVVTPDWPSASGIAGSTDPRQVVAYWSHLGPRVIAIRHGQDGSYVWDGDRNTAWHIPAVPVTVVDPTGAGNSYGGALCAGWLETGDGRTAATFGAVAASFLVERVGFVPMAKDLQAAARDRLRAALPTIRPL
jgi:sugar/nucleoside kinase (ribokinase family)